MQEKKTVSEKFVREWPAVYEGTSTNVTKHLYFRTDLTQVED